MINYDIIFAVINLKKTVLCYLEKDNKYLMLHRVKKKEDINQGKWIGIGGHIEENETPDEALIREAVEETGLTINKYKLNGIIEFVNDDYTELMYLYTSNDFSGRIIDCEEGILKWIPKDEIFNLNLWDGDRIFLEKLLSNDDYFEIRLIYQNNSFIRSENL